MASAAVTNAASAAATVVAPPANPPTNPETKNRFSYPCLDVTQKYFTLAVSPETTCASVIAKISLVIFPIFMALIAVEALIDLVLAPIVFVANLIAGPQTVTPPANNQPQTPRAGGTTAAGATPNSAPAGNQAAPTPTAGATTATTVTTTAATVAAVTAGAQTATVAATTAEAPIAVAPTIVQNAENNANPAAVTTDEKTETTPPKNNDTRPSIQRHVSKKERRERAAAAAERRKLEAASEATKEIEVSTEENRAPSTPKAAPIIAAPLTKSYAAATAGAPTKTATVEDPNTSKVNSPRENPSVISIQIPAAPSNEQPAQTPIGVVTGDDAFNAAMAKAAEQSRSNTQASPPAVVTQPPVVVEAPKAKTPVAVQPIGTPKNVLPGDDAFNAAMAKAAELSRQNTQPPVVEVPKAETPVAAQPPVVEAPKAETPVAAQPPVIVEAPKAAPVAPKPAGTNLAGQSRLLAKTASTVGNDPLARVPTPPKGRGTGLKLSKNHPLVRSQSSKNN